MLQTNLLGRRVSFQDGARKGHIVAAFVDSSACLRLVIEDSHGELTTFYYHQVTLIEQTALK